jgi:hypothetical protein
MARRYMPRLGVASVAALMFAGLYSCGGGGGDGASGGTGGGGGTPSGQSGHVWRSTYSTAASTTITERVAADGSVRQVGVGQAVPWPDGSRFATTDWDTTNTDVRIVDVASGTQRYGVEFVGLVRDLKPSPVNADVVAAREGTSTLGPFNWIVADFGQRTILDRFASTGPGLSWLPDGRFVTVSETGEIRRGSVGQGASASVLGQISLPTGRRVGGAWLNPQGNKIAVRLDLRPTTGASESDLWLADLDGGNLARYTSTRMTTFAAWSPNGQRIAFDVDTGAWCTGSSCQGICEVWHADAGAREVRATATSGDASGFVAGSGRMACSLRGWTN